MKIKQIMLKNFANVIVISAELIDGRIEIVRRYKSGADYTPAPPDRIEKEIYSYAPYLYGIALIQTIEGRIVPGYSVDEQIEFEKQP